MPMLCVLLLAGIGQPPSKSLPLPTTRPATRPDQVVVEFKLPEPPLCVPPRFQYPKDVERPPEKARQSWTAPAGTQLLSHKKPVSSSDKEPIIGTLEQITDGDRMAIDDSIVELSGPQWVQIDLQESCAITGIHLWHGHPYNSVVSHDVVIQLSNDPEFKRDVVTVFNNDTDNSSKLGKGTDREYLESFQGKLIEVTSVKARFVRCHANGDIFTDQTHYTEVEVYGIQPVTPK